MTRGNSRGSRTRDSSNSSRSRQSSRTRGSSKVTGRTSSKGNSSRVSLRVSPVRRDNSSQGSRVSPSSRDSSSPRDRARDNSKTRHRDSSSPRDRDSNRVSRSHRGRVNSRVSSRVSNRVRDSSTGNSNGSKTVTGVPVSGMTSRDHTGLMATAAATSSHYSRVRRHSHPYRSSSNPANRMTRMNRLCHRLTSFFLHPKQLQIMNRISSGSRKPTAKRES